MSIFQTLLPSSLDEFVASSAAFVSNAAAVSVAFVRLSLRLGRCCRLRRIRPSVAPSRTLLPSPSHSSVCRSVSNAAAVSVAFVRLSLRLERCCRLRRIRPSVAPSRTLLPSPSHSSVCRSVSDAAAFSVWLPSRSPATAASGSVKSAIMSAVVVCATISVRTLPRRVGTKVRCCIHSKTYTQVSLYLIFF